jgi:hypothetical protein
MAFEALVVEQRRQSTASTPREIGTEVVTATGATHEFRAATSPTNSRLEPRIEIADAAADGVRR